MTKRICALVFSLLVTTAMSGAVRSQGAPLIGASVYHDQGFYGQGVKIAIVDSEFGGLTQAMLLDDVPGGALKRECDATTCVPAENFEQGSAHGTAVAEVVYDIAPAAKLHLLKILPGAGPEALKGVLNYCIANQIKIVSMSMVWFDYNFFDGSCYRGGPNNQLGPACYASQAEANGILWINGIGN